MAKKAAPRSKQQVPRGSGTATVKKSTAAGKAKKSTAGKAAANKRTANKKKPLKTTRKVYPPGNSKQVSYDLVYVADSDIHGKGLFAHKTIESGVSLGRLEGTATTSDGTYVLWLTARKGLRITNEFRFINHSSRPNCALTGTEVTTLKKIKPHEELTHDYGW